MYYVNYQRQTLAVKLQRIPRRGNSANKSWKNLGVIIKFWKNLTKEKPN